MSKKGMEILEEKRKRVLNCINTFEKNVKGLSSYEKEVFKDYIDGLSDSLKDTKRLYDTLNELLIPAFSKVNANTKNVSQKEYPDVIKKSHRLTAGVIGASIGIVTLGAIVTVMGGPNPELWASSIKFLGAGVGGGFGVGSYVMESRILKKNFDPNHTTTRQSKLIKKERKRKEKIRTTYEQLEEKIELALSEGTEVKFDIKNLLGMGRFARAKVQKTINEFNEENTQLEDYLNKFETRLKKHINKTTVATEKVNVVTKSNNISTNQTEVPVNQNQNTNKPHKTNVPKKQKIQPNNTNKR